MMPRLVETAPAGEGWIHEVKFDGYRSEVLIEAGQVSVFTRSGIDWTNKYGPIGAAAAALKCRSAILDGEIYLPDARGASDFHNLRSAITRRPHELVFVGFDLLHLDGEDFRSRRLEDRRFRLRELLESAPSSSLAFSPVLEADGPAAFTAVEAMGLEGIVSKRLGSRYKSGDTDAWQKTKAFTVDTFEVIGVDRTDKRGIPLALLARAEPEGLRYAGDAIINLPTADRDAFWKFVDEHAVTQVPIKGLKRPGTWLPHGLAATVKHLRGEEMLRHATLTGLSRSR